MSHQSSHIIINSSFGGDGSRTTGSGTDEIEIRYSPDPRLTPEQVGKEVAKRLRWIHTMPHADAADT
jgi:hypothetical protein